MVDISQLREKLKDRPIGSIGKHKYFSVIVPLIMTEDGLSLIFEVRASKLRTQPGDICFPGGNIEKGETPLEGAIRETKEEIGIEIFKEDILGQFDTMYGFSGYSLYTFIAEVEADAMEKLSTNEDEVAEVFTVPLQFFIENPAVHYDMDVVSKTEDFPYEETGISSDYNWRVGKNIIPLYNYKGKVIWGVTARIIEDFVNKLCI